MATIYVVDACGSESWIRKPQQPTIYVYEIDDSEFLRLEAQSEDMLYEFLPSLKEIAKPKRIIEPDLIVTV